MQQAPRSKPFTGWHMTAILVAGFGVVIAVNVLMARLATSTFGGVVVENSYVASQHFNRWLDEAAKEKSLGWRIAATRRPDGHVAVALAGPAGPVRVAAEARHPLGQASDIALVFTRNADGRWVSDRPLPAGRWTLRFDVESQGRSWRSEQPVS